MASFDYGTTDIAPAASNAIVVGLVTVGSFAALIVMVMLYGYVKKKIQ
jgi:hypothetical protein